MTFYVRSNICRTNFSHNLENHGATVVVFVSVVPRLEDCTGFSTLFSIGPLYNFEFYMKFKYEE